jgi:nicotinamide riboside transporter PnuC
MCVFIKDLPQIIGNGERTLINRDSFYYQRVGEHGRFVTSVVTIAAMLARHGLIVATLRTFRSSSNSHPTADLIFISIAVLLLSVRRLISHWLLARVIDVAADVLILLYGVIGGNITSESNAVNPAFVASLALMFVILLLRLVNKIKA